MGRADEVLIDDFEVAIFLRESGTRHSLLTKQKNFGKKEGITSNSNKLIERNTHEEIPVESDDEADVPMSNIPTAIDGVDEAQQDDGEDVEDKKFRLTTSYEGFSIWGWILCLLVTRKGTKAVSATAASTGSGQALMEEWIGTQVQAGLDED